MKGRELSGPPGADRSLAKRTFAAECARAVPSGFLEACLNSFFLLIALKWFKAVPATKAFIVAGGNAGMLLTPLLLRVAQRSKKPSTTVAAVVLMAGGCVLGVAALVGGLVVYAVATVIGMGSFNLVVPLITTAYQRNYGPAERGRNASLTLMVRFGTSALCAWVVGRWLDHHLSSYRIVLLAGAAALILSGVAVWRVESDPIPDDRRRTLRTSLALMRHDRTLATTMNSWMFMGLANLVMIPLRTEYLANARYGINARPSRVAILVIAIPAVARVTMSPVFGWVFDRTSFFTTRIFVNVGFAASILAFFTGRSMVGLVTGSILFGVAAAGGDILWNLWATKLAPPHQVADYMALHTFFTGVRGAIAPFLAYWLVTHFPVWFVGAFAATLIGVASAILIPELVAARKVAVSPS